MMADKPFAPAAERNAAAILEVLNQEFQNCKKVLEIGSGTGQHAVFLAAALPHLSWQTSDLEENHAAINAWLADSGTSNVRPPLSLDVRDANIAGTDYDAVFSANTAHIMSFDAVVDMFALVGRVLRPDGIFGLYGPFLIDGRFTTPSNEQFDADLRARDPAMGIRDLADLDSLGAGQGLRREALFAMPANNFVATWRKVE